MTFDKWEQYVVNLFKENYADRIRLISGTEAHAAARRLWEKGFVKPLPPGHYSATSKLGRFLWPCLLVGIILTGCANTPPQEQVWRDLEGTQTEADLRQDAARCDYEMAQMGVMAPQRDYPSRSTSAFGQAVDNLGSAMLQGPGPRVWESCMRAAGWQRLE